MPSALSKTISTEALPTGLRPVAPLKITSVMSLPRKCFADISPITQRTASMILDLPQPLGPTTPIRLDGNCTVVGSTKDLNPANFSLDKRMCSPETSRVKLPARDDPLGESDAHVVPLAYVV